MSARPKVFSTCPPSNRSTGDYLGEVRQIARWSEEAGCEGMLVYTDNGLVDAWLVSQVVLEATSRMCPLVAVQPVYMHPYWAAKMVATMGQLHGRKVYLNMVAGGFKTDLAALNDETPHDRRYDRLVEYTTIIQQLLKAAGPVTYQGQFYRVKNLNLVPSLPEDLYPGFMVSGSSDAGLAAARQLDAIAVQYPKPVHEYETSPPPEDLSSGMRIGIIARENSGAAWGVARARFPEDRKGKVTHKLAMRVSDSEWHRQLSKLGAHAAGQDNPYWLVPFENYKTFCPYLVGSYDEVAQEVARYISAGYRTLILDVPASPSEMEHIGEVLSRATSQAVR